jgi:hypothetical protein
MEIATATSEEIAILGPIPCFWSLNVHIHQTLTYDGWTDKILNTKYE